MINQNLKEVLNEKIEEGEFDVADIPAYLTLFCEMGNEVEELQEEVADWDRRVNFELAGTNAHWLIIEDGRFSTGAGMLDDADLVLKLDAGNAALIFAGDMDAKAAYMSGALKVEGELPDAVKMQTLIEIVGEEIEY
jgi:putative sterol carrier protein